MRIVDVQIITISADEFGVRVHLDNLEEVDLNIAKKAIPMAGYISAERWLRGDTGRAWLRGLVIGKKVDELMKNKPTQLKVTPPGHAIMLTPADWKDIADDLHTARAIFSQDLTPASEKFIRYVETMEGTQSE